MCQTWLKLVWDMNRDGAFTVSDIGQWIEWLFFIPGVLIVSGASKAPSIAQFFELTSQSCRGGVSTTLSMSIWICFFFVIVGAYISVKESQ